jgi:hypothetical protein
LVSNLTNQFIMRIKKYLSVLILTTILVSCSEDVIDIQPQDAVIPEIALKRVSGINALVLSAYRRIHEFGYYGQNQMLNAEALADNLIIANNTGRYTGQVVNGVGSHFGTWSASPYRIINDANLVLKYADAAEPALSTSGLLAGLPESEAVTAPRRLRYKGEALFLRALALHDLAKVYGYEPGKEVGNFNLSAIIRTTPVEGVTDANKRARSTNVEVYQQIETDLLEAINLLPAETDFIGSSSNPAQQWATGEKWFRASKQAAKALLARVYLYEGKFTEANNYATQVIAESSRTLVTAASYAASWSTATHPESLFEAEIRTADWSSVDGVNNSIASITNSSPSSASNAQFAVAGSAELIAAFEAGDARRNVWVTNAGRFECKKWQGEKGNFLENIPMIRLSEVYLIAAEARANSSDEAGALTVLNTLRAARGLAASDASGQTLLDLILNERRVEFAFEGHRFFDLKRLGKDIVKPASLGINNVPYSDYRILGNIPNAEITYNELLVQNPNY